MRLAACVQSTDYRPREPSQLRSRLCEDLHTTWALFLSQSSLSYATFASVWAARSMPLLFDPQLLPAALPPRAVRFLVHSLVWEVAERDTHTQRLLEQVVSQRMQLSVQTIVQQTLSHSQTHTQTPTHAHTHAHTEAMAVANMLASVTEDQARYARYLCVFLCLVYTLYIVRQTERERPRSPIRITANQFLCVERAVQGWRAIDGAQRGRDVSQIWSFLCERHALVRIHSDRWAATITAPATPSVSSAPPLFHAHSLLETMSESDRERVCALVRASYADHIDYSGPDRERARQREIEREALRDAGRGTVSAAFAPVQSAQEGIPQNTLSRPSETTTQAHTETHTQSHTEKDAAYDELLTNKRARLMALKAQRREKVQTAKRERLLSRVFRRSHTDTDTHTDTHTHTTTATTIASAVRPESTAESVEESLVAYSVSERDTERDFVAVPATDDVPTTLEEIERAIEAELAELEAMRETAEEREGEEEQPMTRAALRRSTHTQRKRVVSAVSESETTAVGGKGRRGRKTATAAQQSDPSAPAKRARTSKKQTPQATTSVTLSSTTTTSATAVTTIDEEIETEPQTINNSELENLENMLRDATADLEETIEEHEAAAAAKDVEAEANTFTGDIADLEAEILAMINN